MEGHESRLCTCAWWDVRRQLIWWNSDSRLARLTKYSELRPSVDQAEWMASRPELSRLVHDELAHLLIVLFTTKHCSLSASLGYLLSLLFYLHGFVDLYFVCNMFSLYGRHSTSVETPTRRWPLSEGLSQGRGDSWICIRYLCTEMLEPGGVNAYLSQEIWETELLRLTHSAPRLRSRTKHQTITLYPVPSLLATLQIYLGSGTYGMDNCLCAAFM